MGLTTIQTDSDRERALELLREGFPHLPDRDFWWKGLTAPQSPVFANGLLLEVGGRAEGVILLFEHLRAIDGRHVPFVNLSSWYIRPRFRARALQMLLAITKDDRAVITDVSASRAVAKMLPTLGFRCVARGSKLVPAFPLAALPGSRKTPVVMDELGSGAEFEAARSQVAAHRGTRFLVGHLAAEMGDVPFAFRVRRRRGLNLVWLAHCLEPRLLRDCLPQIARQLIRRRVVGFVLPRTAAFESMIGVGLEHYFPIYVKGDIPDRWADLLFSEFLYLDI